MMGVKILKVDKLALKIPQDFNNFELFLREEKSPYNSREIVSVDETEKRKTSIWKTV